EAECRMWMCHCINTHHWTDWPDLRALRSFPTRRSSDLNWIGKTWPAERFAEVIAWLTGEGGPMAGARAAVFAAPGEEAQARPVLDRKSTRLNSSHVENSYAVFWLKKKKAKILAA